MPEPSLAVHGRDLAPLLGDGVEHLDRVQPLGAVVAADGVQTVLHDGDADTTPEHRHRLGVAPTAQDGVVNLENEMSGNMRAP